MFLDWINATFPGNFPLVLFVRPINLFLNANNIFLCKFLSYIQLNNKTFKGAKKITGFLTTEKKNRNNHFLNFGNYKNKNVKQ